MSYFNSIPQTVPAPFSEPPPSPSQPTGKRRKISTACGCSGGNPCTACIGRGSACFYDATADQRRKVAVHRNLQDLTETRATLERTQHVLGALVAVIRAGSQETVRNLLATVQSGVDLPQVAAHVRNALLSDPAVQNAYDEISFHIDESTELPPAASILSQHSSESPTEANIVRSELSLVRSENQSDTSSESIREQQQHYPEPIFRLTAKPWTKVTNDDYLVSHLVSIWFTWMYPWWQWVDKDNFIESMQQKDISSPLCTTYMVNMILADACLLDVGNGENSIRSDLSGRFHQEAVRIMDSISERPASMCLVSTLGIQWTYLNTIGDDKRGLKVLAEQLEKFEDLDQWRRNLRVPGPMLRKVDIGLDRLAWTLYTLKGLSLMSLEQLRPPNPPDRPKPVRDVIKDQRHDHNPQQPWIVYPTLISRTFHYECHYSCFLSLAETICKDEALLRGTGKGDKEADDEFEECFKSLETWPSRLPNCMQLGEQSTPHVLALHAIYLWAFINIVKQANAAAKGRLSRPELIEGHADPRSRWTTIAYDAAVRVSEILMTHSWLWGSQHFPVIIIQPISLALFILLGDLSDAVHARAFSNLIFWVYSVSARLKVAEGVLDLVEKKANELEIEIPQEAKSYFDSRRAKTDDSTDADVEYLLGKWDDFDLKG